MTTLAVRNHAFPGVVSSRNARGSTGGMSVAKTGMAVWESNYPSSVYRRSSFQTSLCMLFPATIHRAPS